MLVALRRRQTCFPNRTGEARSCRWWLPLFGMGLFGSLLAVPTSATAGTVELRNGFVLHGNPSKLQSLTRATTANTGPVPVYSIVMVQTGWQRYYVPARQIPDHGLNLDLNLNRSEEFTVPQIKQTRGEVVQSLGSIVSTTAFDDQFGRRTVTLATSRGNLPVVQGITKIAADHVMVTGLTHNWEFGLGLNTVPRETIYSILQNPLVCKPNDPQDRLARARFYIAAEWYPQAFAELDAVAADFPDFQDRANMFRQELLQLFGRHVLRELGSRRKVGQFVLADQAALQIPSALVGGAVQREVQQFLTNSRREIDDLERIAVSLGELQAQLAETALRERVAAARTQLLLELDRSSLGVLQPYLQALSDPQRSASEKLGLAISAWVVGADAAGVDLERALRLWEARGLVREYLKSDNPIVRDQLFDELRKIEGVGTNGMRQLLQRLPPPLDSETILPGEVAAVTLPAYGETPELTYQVLLPPEYSPNRRYPCIVALRPEHRTAEQTVALWGGDEETPGWSQRRGYIVIAPEYAPEGQREYNYSATAHVAVSNCLRDARLRFAIDPDRVFLAGHEMGADAAFDLGMSYPDQFAGVIPIGGVVDHYGRFLTSNCQYTSWYIVRGELGRDAQALPMSKFVDNLYVGGYRHDVIYAEYIGRGRDAYTDEFPKLFEWMDLHSRETQPLEFSYKTMRKCDNRPFWIDVEGLPRHVILPAPPGTSQRVDTMTVSGRITPGNSISVTSPAAVTRVRLSEELVNLDEKVTLRLNGTRKFSKFLEPDLQALLEDFRRHADRSRLASIVLEF